MKKILSIVLSVVMLFGVNTTSLTVNAASGNTVKTSITKVESKAKGFKVTFKKKSKIKGYQIQYSTSSKFKSSNTKTITSSKTTSATISKLKGCNVKYYVRVRTYKVSNSKKIYSSWSKTKTVTTLKHKYNKATCTKPKTCSVCKKTSGKKLGHNYIKGICDKCGKTKYSVATKAYSGRWFLKGYSDIYIDITRIGRDEAMHIEAVGISLPGDSAASNSYVLYPEFVDEYNDWYHAIDIPFSTWKKSIKEKKINFCNTHIKLGKRVFTKEKGTKDKYTGTFCKEALGTWYLQNSPEVQIVIEKCGGNKNAGDFYSIETTNFNLITFKNNINDFSTITAADKGDWKKLGISINNGALTITNKNGTRTFYKTKTYQKVSGISLDTTNMNLYIGDSKTLKATILPYNAYDKTVVWSSSNTSVATVSTSGVVTAKGEGTTTITVKTQDGNYTATCNVNVSVIHVNGITLNKTSLNMTKGDTQQLSATITPSNAYNKSVIWSSDNENVAQVSSNGKITAKGKGTTIITVKSADGGHTATCEVVVKEAQLTVSASIGIGYYMSSSVSVRGVFCEIKPSGGSGNYVSYYIKLYYNGTLVAEAAKNEVIVTPVKNGTYTAEVYVKDSSGNEATAIKTTTISY